MNNFKVGDYVYRPSHPLWGKCEIVSFSNIVECNVSTVTVTVKILSREYPYKLLINPKLVPAEVYESGLYKALHE